jgi:non-homologous end joining protein Ku
MTRTIEIEEFVNLAEIEVQNFDNRMLWPPGNKGEKGYVLLREAIRDGRRGFSSANGCQP